MIKHGCARKKWTNLEKILLIFHIKAEKTSEKLHIFKNKECMAITS